MRLHKILLYLPGLLMLGILPSCAANPPPLAQVTSEAIGTPSPTPDIDATVFPLTPESTAQALPITLSIWLPENLAPVRNTDVQSILTDQIEAFQRAQSGITVDRRLKKPDGEGGLVETLLSASIVAPSEVPDLILVHRQSLSLLVARGLAKSLDDRLSSALMGDLYTSALQLGEAGSQLYGLPYALEIQHVAYQPPTADFAHFDTVLASDRPLVLPVGQVNGLSDVLLTQYLAAGGTLVDGKFGPLNVDALRETLEFYESAVAQGIIDSAVLNYPAPEDYLAGLLDGRIQAAVVTSDMYLDLVDSGEIWRTDSIPVAGGQPSTVLDGWVWVITADDAEHQQAAVRYLEWVFSPARQGAYTRAVHMLPSGRAAMRAWGNPTYTAFAGELITNAVLPLSENETNTTARAMQSALVSVISGERTAAEATQDVVRQVAG